MATLASDREETEGARRKAGHFGMVRYEGEPAAIQDELAGLSPATRPVFDNAARTAYAAYAEILYGTPAPPRIGVDPLSDKD